MSKHQYEIRISESCVYPNPLMVGGQDTDNFTRFQTRERCALEIAAYVFKLALYLIVTIYGSDAKVMIILPTLSVKIEVTYVML